MVLERLLKINPVYSYKDSLSRGKFTFLLCIGDTQAYVSETDDFYISYHFSDTAAAIGSLLPAYITHVLRLIPKVPAVTVSHLAP